MSRSASIERNTSETKIKLSIDLDGTLLPMNQDEFVTFYILKRYNIQN